MFHDSFPGSEGAAEAADAISRRYQMEDRFRLATSLRTIGPLDHRCMARNIGKPFGQEGSIARRPLLIVGGTRQLELPWPTVGDSERCRSRFRADGDHHSEPMPMPITFRRSSKWRFGFAGIRNCRVP